MLFDSREAKKIERYVVHSQDLLVLIEKVKK